MEITSLFIGIVIGAISGSIVLYFILKSRNVPREIFDELNGNFIRSNADLQNSKLKISELDDLYQKEKEINFDQANTINGLKNEIATISAEHHALQNQFQELRELNANQSSQIEILTKENQKIFARNAELSAINNSLQQSLNNQKAEIEKIQETAKNEFKNLANEILEEKSKKFTE